MGKGQSNSFGRSAMGSGQLNSFDSDLGHGDEAMEAVAERNMSPLSCDSGWRSWL